MNCEFVIYPKQVSLVCYRLFLVYLFWVRNLHLIQVLISIILNFYTNLTNFKKNMDNRYVNKLKLWRISVVEIEPTIKPTICMFSVEPTLECKCSLGSAHFRLIEFITRYMIHRWAILTAQLKFMLISFRDRTCLLLI